MWLLNHCKRGTIDLHFSPQNLITGCFWDTSLWTLKIRSGVGKSWSQWLLSKDAMVERVLCHFGIYITLQPRQNAALLAVATLPVLLPTMTQRDTSPFCLHYDLCCYTLGCLKNMSVVNFKSINSHNSTVANKFSRASWVQNLVRNL